MSGFEQTEQKIDAECAADDPNTAPVTACRKSAIHVRIVVKDERFRVVRAVPYKLTVGKEEFSGTLDGVIDHVVKEGSGRGKLEVTFGEDEVETWDISLEPLDPLSLESGVTARLGALMPAEAALDDEYAAAISGLREAFGVEEGETIDAATRELVGRVYSADDTPSEDAEAWVEPESVQEEVARITGALRAVTRPALELLEEER